VQPVRSFLAFWYDFLVGDRPELFLGTLGTLVVAWLLVRADAPAAMAGVAMVACVALVLGLSLARAIRRR
jgi:hypothetical protein